jgi:hypothetical protein
MELYRIFAFVNPNNLSKSGDAVSVVGEALHEAPLSETSVLAVSF